MSILQGTSCSIAKKSGEIWPVQKDLQQINPKSDRHLDPIAKFPIPTRPKKTAVADCS